MTFWSAENATNAYLKTIRMGKKRLEPDVAEFISALAAGNNAQLIVLACENVAKFTTTLLALVAAATLTGGHVICVVPDDQQSRKAIGFDACHVEFVTGEPENLLLTRYKEADFVLIDCNLVNHESVLESVAICSGMKRHGCVVLGYNAFRRGSNSRWSSGTASGGGSMRTQLLPIGEGLLVTRFASRTKHMVGERKNSHWVVRVDKRTGEEHLFRVRSPQGKQIEAQIVESGRISILAGSVLSTCVRLQKGSDEALSLKLDY